MMMRGLTGMKMATIIAVMTMNPPNTNGGPGTVSCNGARLDTLEMAYIQNVE